MDFIQTEHAVADTTATPSRLTKASAIKLSEETKALTKLVEQAHNNIYAFIWHNPSLYLYECRQMDSFHYLIGSFELVWEFRSFVPIFEQIFTALDSFQSFEGDLCDDQGQALTGFHHISHYIARCELGIRRMQHFFGDIDRIDIDIVNSLRTRYLEAQVRLRYDYNNRLGDSYELEPVSDSCPETTGSAVLRLFTCLPCIADPASDNVITAANTLFIEQAKIPPYTQSVSPLSMCPNLGFGGEHPRTLIQDSPNKKSPPSEARNLNADGIDEIISSGCSIQ
ncbi:hypothetical protein GGR57DRAFT_508932 [Xylariaceae sp. FL1272]|nr:hypothetical protein GGR57DRAFT_508932 [Xylariaceae sp. FL1272]